MARPMTDAEVQRLLETVETQFGCRPAFKGRLYALEGKRSLRIFLYSGGPIPDMRQSWLGMHMGDLHEDSFMPSIEGTGLIGQGAVKAVVELPRDQAEKAFNGETIPCEPFEGTALVKTGQRVVCPARYENGGLKAVIPESRKTTE